MKNQALEEFEALENEYKLHPKFNRLNHCDDCGAEFIPPLSKEILDYQELHRENHFVRVSCDECIAKNHTITDEELGTVEKRIYEQN